MLFVSDGESGDQLWRTLPCLSRLQSSLDLAHTCGFVSLLDLRLSESEPNDSSFPTNGKVKKESADLLEEELDSLEIDNKAKPPMTLGVQEMKVEPRRPPNWVLLDLTFGVPLFDADLNKEVCGKITQKGLCRKER